VSGGGGRFSGGGYLGLKWRTIYQTLVMRGRAIGGSARGGWRVWMTGRGVVVGFGDSVAVILTTTRFECSALASQSSWSDFCYRYWNLFQSSDRGLHTLCLFVFFFSFPQL